MPILIAETKRISNRLTRLKMAFTIAVLLFVKATNAQSGGFSIGVYDSLHSNVFNENRKILIYVPNDTKDSLIRYPVLYILDGESHFVKTIGILDFLSNTIGNELCPKMIVVAIYSPDREEDLIPPVSDESTIAKDKFPVFLEKELIPFIDSHYPTQPYKVLAGHSLGGLRVINTFIRQPQLFNSYIALDPSLGHEKEWIDNAGNDFDKGNYADKYLYVAMGHTMPKGMDTSAILKDTTGDSRHMRCIMNFAKRIETSKKVGLSFQWKYYPDESHQSIVFKGTYDALTTNFKWFRNEKLYDIFKEDVSAEAAVRIITDYYEQLSIKMGYRTLSPEQETSNLIDYLIFKRWYIKALAFAQLNAKNYPLSKTAINQLENATWKTKKSVAVLLFTKTAKEVYQLCKKEALKKDPEYDISEDAINTLGYDLLRQNKRGYAELIFKLNIDLYPGSYNAYDSYAECLLSLGKEKQAISAYKKSLGLNPRNSNAESVLKKYGKMK
jgi:predicted alpha/beta superfamily hydrolase